MARHAISLLMLVLLCGLLFADSWLTAQEPTDSYETALKDARAIADELTGELKRLLSNELAKGGFAGAVRVCGEKAQTLAGQFNAAKGASARRVSQRYRNPNDRPDPYEEAILVRWQTLHHLKQLPEESVEVTTDAKGRRHLRYLRPIVVQGMCLTCHGTPEKIPDEVREVIRQRYPTDLATGYAAGDLRGAVSVRVPLNGEDGRDR